VQTRIADATRMHIGKQFLLQNNSASKKELTEKNKYAFRFTVVLL
jgi:hypothetical protein